MAWRIHDNVRRGEVDNRQQGTVRGKIWLHGCDEPVVLELEGNACADLAGCLLTFENSGQTLALPSDSRLHPVQRGSIGDLTASRKVRVFDLPLEEALDRKHQGLPVPEHLANCLYLEWFSEANGRVVIESTDYTLTISAPAWTLSPEEEQQRQQAAADGFAGFLGRLTDALAASKHEPPPDKEWDEFDYEKFMRESDARTDKYGELLDKYMDHPDREKLIAREMGWTRLEEALEAQAAGEEAPSDPAAAGAPEDEPDEAGDEPEGASRGWEFPDELPEPVPDPATEGVDWVRDEHGDIGHPLALRAFKGSVALSHACKELGLGKLEDEDLGGLISEFQITSAKLAGALNSLAYGREHREGAFIVAYLKRALGHLHGAQGALEKVAPKHLLPAATLGATRRELFELREEILRLMEEFRGRSH